MAPLLKLSFFVYNNLDTYNLWVQWCKLLCVLTKTTSIIFSSWRVCNGSQLPHISFFHVRNVVCARSLSAMCAARHDMIQVACGFAAHTVFALPVAPQMFRCRGGDLSRAHSVGRPPCTPLPLFLPLRGTGFCGRTQERLGF